MPVHPLPAPSEISSRATKTRTRTATLAAILAGACTLASHAQPVALPSLAITEVWPGGLPGEESTSDWIEITNFGDTPFDAWSTVRLREDVLPTTVPNGLPVTGGVFVGVPALGPGESAVFLTDYFADFFDGWSPSAPRIFNPASFAEAAEAFTVTWGPQVANVKLGALDNSATGQPWEGFNRGGETVSLYVADDGNTFVTGGMTLVDAVEYPVSDVASWSFAPAPTGDPLVPRTGTLSVDGLDGAFTGVNPANGSLLPVVTPGPPPIGSPGTIPEPAAALLMLLAPALRRRR